MPSVFEDVTLIYKGEEFKVPSDKVMPLIEIIESQLPIEELAKISDSYIPRTKISKAYARALNYAGCNVKQEDIYASFFSGESIENITSVINGLMQLMIPPEHLRQDISGLDEKMEEAKTKSKKPRKNSKEKV